VHTVLDSRALDLSTRRLPTIRRKHLGMGRPAPHRPEDLTGIGGRRMIESIADAAAGINHGAALAPTHFLGEGNANWLDVDATRVCALRKALDDRDLTKVLIYYTQALPARRPRSSYPERAPGRRTSTTSGDTSYR
jgi:hypothetical protein